MKKSLLILPLIFVFLPRRAYSQDINAIIPNKGAIKQQIINRPEEAQELREEVRNKVQERLQEKCAQIEERIRKRTENFEANKARHIERYESFKAKLQEIITKLKAKGYDTSQLESDLAEFDALVNAYAKEYAEFISMLQSSQGFICGESQGEFRNSLEGAREQLIRARTARRAVWEFYKNTLREDLKEIRQQAESLHTETNE